MTEAQIQKQKTVIDRTNKNLLSSKVLKGETKSVLTYEDHTLSKLIFAMICK